MSVGQIESSAIDESPIEVDGDGDGIMGPLDRAFQEIGDLTAALSQAEAEIGRLKTISDIEAVKARMLEPYVNKVFNFVAVYCGFVAIILFLCAMDAGFKLPETILAIISGSTAVSVIGLIGLVITGLFGKRS